MPDAFRIVKKRFSSTAFDGYGAKQFGGRWNCNGVPVVYTADSPSLAVLEMLVHVERSELMAHYELCRLTIADELIMELPEAELPFEWRASPPPPRLAEIGSEWAREGLSAALSVPSAVIPMQRNFLLNPLHPDFPQLVASGQWNPFWMDARL